MSTDPLANPSARRVPREHERVLVLPPTPRDSLLTRSTLERAGIDAAGCDSIRDVLATLEEGAGALLLAEEALQHPDAALLGAWLANQPAWSDLPIILIAQHGAESPAVMSAMVLLGNVTVIERPVRVATLVSTVRAALRGRRWQYDLRDQLVDRERNLAAYEQLTVMLSEADRRKDEFLAILSHELRNPLAPIRNSLAILRLRGHESGNEHVVDVMERQVNQMVRLVDDLLEVSRITRGKLELRREAVDVTSVLRSAVETSRPLIAAARHRLAVSLPVDPLTVNGDAIRLTQVVANLLNNAARYTEPGGQIWVSAHRDGGSVRIAVRDSGIGIPPDLLDSAFEMFTQIHPRTENPHGGLGIGLTLVKRLVEMHGGSVVAHSEGTGRGAEFIVTLPLVHATPRSVASAFTGPDASMAGLRFMLVDDNHDAAESLGALLTLLGAECRVVYSGAEALDALQSWLPDVMLLDIGMPVMDGFELARRIRAVPALDMVSLIALTGWGQPEARDRTQRAGFSGHLIKPVDIETLRSLLERRKVKRRTPVAAGAQSTQPRPAPARRGSS